MPPTCFELRGFILRTKLCCYAVWYVLHVSVWAVWWVGESFPFSIMGLIKILPTRPHTPKHIKHTILHIRGSYRKSWATFFACELGTAEEGECEGRWNQLLCYPCVSCDVNSLHHVTSITTNKMADNDMSFRQRAVIKFLVKEEIPAAEIHQRLQRAYGSVCTGGWNILKMGKRRQFRKQCFCFFGWLERSSTAGEFSNFQNAGRNVYKEVAIMWKNKDIYVD